MRRVRVKPASLFAAVSIAFGVSVTGPAIAHHSNAAFYSSNELEGVVTIEGVFTDIKLVNPHAFYRVMVVEAGGEEVEWIVETRPWLTFQKDGWKQDTIKVGDRVRLTVMKNRRFEHSGRIREMLVLGRTADAPARLFLDYTNEVANNLPGEIMKEAPACEGIVNRCVELGGSVWADLAGKHGDSLPVLRPPD
jgi:uncharacterized protein DUF6152